MKSFVSVITATTLLIAGTVLLHAQTEVTPLAPSGHFEGTASSQQAGQLDLALDLIFQAGHYTGKLATPIGPFTVEDGHVDAVGLHLTLRAGTNEAAIDAVYDAPVLRGTFTAADDRGPLELRRLGEARAPAAEDAAKLTNEQWHQDLQFLAAELPKRHANAFHFVSRADFAAAVSDLDRKLDTINPDEIFFGMERIVNLIGDGHTYLKNPADAANLPIDIMRFRDDYRVVAAANGNEATLGGRVLRVGDEPISRARELLLPCTPADESAVLRDPRVSGFLTTGIYLHGAGIIPDRSVAHYTLMDGAGKEFAVDVHAVAPGESAKLNWTYPFEKRPLFRDKPGEAFWYVYLTDAKTVYCSFRGYDDLATKARGLFALVESAQPEKVVIDMRLNGGGDYHEGLKCLVEPLRKLPAINRKDRLFVLVGANTFSAAMSNAAQFRYQTKAILVGEQIGEKPNSYQEPREMTLPNSGWTVRYSTQFYQFVPNGENMIRPDKEIVPTWEDYRSGRDPVIEWVLNQHR